MDKENFTIEEAIRHKLDDTREGRVVLGDFVTESNYGRKGRVTAIHTDCPESQSCIDGQTIPVTKWEQNAERWISILLDDGGSIVVTENKLTVVEPFKMRNNWYAHYFGINDPYYDG